MRISTLIQTTIKERPTAVIHEVGRDKNPTRQRGSVDVHRKIVAGRHPLIRLEAPTDKEGPPTHKFLILFILSGTDTIELARMNGLCFRCSSGTSMSFEEEGSIRSGDVHAPHSTCRVSTKRGRGN
jgi:hypothetical protein